MHPWFVRHFELRIIMVALKKAFTETEDVVGPALPSEEMLGKTDLSKVRELPTCASNDTMARRVDRIGEDLEDQLVAKKLLV